MSDAEPTLRDVLGAVTDLRRDMLTGFQRQDRRSDEHDKRFDEVDRRLDEHDKRFDEVDKRFDEVDKRFGEVDKRFDEVDKRFDEHARLLEGLSESVREVWQLVGSTNRRHSERFDGLELQMLKQREEFAALKGHVTSSIGILKDLIEARDFRLDDHGRRLNALETPRPADP
jgi:archaellum component FlaC